MPRFALRPACADVEALAARYAYADDSAVRRIGAAAQRRGWYEPSEVREIVRWKAARAAGGVERDDERIREATRYGLAKVDEAERMECLTALEGVVEGVGGGPGNDSLAAASRADQALAVTVLGGL